MKSLGVLVCAGLIGVAPAAAQFSLRTGSLGGPASARAFSRPLGGVSPVFNGLSANRFSRGTYRGPIGYPYVYSVWVPDYYDYLNYQNQYGLPPDPYAPAPPPAAAPQPPVIINQYFGAPPPAQGPPPQGSVPQQGDTSSTFSNNTGSNNAFSNNTSAQAPGDPIGPPKNYYLIAYKNHTIYSALAYWVEDKTLHYVTTENTHNQASLDLIDVALTKQLNERNEVPFSLPGQ